MTLQSDFPMGMRVLAIDDDPASLKSLENLLTQCQYNVEVTTRPTIAMRILRGNRGRQFDMIVTDVHAQGVDGFKFIKLIDDEFHIPVIIVSEDGSRETIAKAVAHGSCDYLLKPVRLQELRNLWTHVLRRKLVSKGRLITGDINLCVLQDEREHHSNAVAPDEQKRKLRSLIPKEAKRKRRLRWTEELHHKFLAAVHALGLNKAVPKKILELMNVGDLTLDHVSSHLQKYKLYVKKLSAVTGHHALVAAKTKLVPASFELSGQSQQQQQQQTQPMMIQDASGNNSFIGAIDNFQDPNDNTDSLPPDCTELFCDLIDFDSLDQLLQHDQTWQYGVAAADQAPATVLSDLPSVLMTPLFGSDSFDSDSDFSRILQPIISADDDDSSPTPQANFSNHLMQSPQQEWHQTIYDQNSSSSSMPNFEVTGTDLLHQASSEEADRNATIEILESGRVLQYA